MGRVYHNYGTANNGGRIGERTAACERNLKVYGAGADLGYWSLVGEIK
jgi:hypothetical protein